VEQKIASGVLRIIDYKPAIKSLLYLTAPSSNNTDADAGSDLVLVNTENWVLQPIANNVLTANLSPDGTKIAIWTKDYEVHILAANGAHLQKIGVHGAAPLFSRDGKLLVYEKLANDSSDNDLQGLFEFAEGIVIYDLQSGQERVVTSGGPDDFAPVGFSPDMSKLYFNSTRPSTNDLRAHLASLWVVDLHTGHVKQLTNIGSDNTEEHVPIINENAIWTSDYTTVISSNGPQEGVWKFVFSKDGNSLSAIHIADGYSPQWIVPGKSIAIRTSVGQWEKLNLK
jgi:Tol biopolymer transport system component